MPYVFDWAYSLVSEPDNCFALFYFVTNEGISHVIITLIRYFLIPKSRDLVLHNPGISGLKKRSGIPGSRDCNPYTALNWLIDRLEITIGRCTSMKDTTGNNNNMKDVGQINGLNIQCVRAKCKQVKVKVDVNNLHLQMTSRRSKSETLRELMWHYFEHL